MLAVAGIGGYVWYKNYRQPKVVVLLVDWLKGEANLTVDGNIVFLKKGRSVLLPNLKYSISYIAANTVDKTDRIVLLKNGLQASVLSENIQYNADGLSDVNAGVI